MLIPIKEYAKMHNITSDTVLQRCNRGIFLTAKKVGRNWYIDDSEKLIDHRLKSSTCTATSHKQHPAPSVFLPDDYIALKEYSEIHGKVYKVLHKKAIRGGFKTALKIGNQWFIHKHESCERINKSVK